MRGLVNGLVRSVWRAGLGVVLIAGVGLSPALAETYRWVTPDGAMHYGDAMPSNQALRGYDIIDPSTGSVLKHIDRAKTPQELQAMEDQKAAAAKKAEADAVQARHDRMLLDLYASVNDIRRVRDHRIAELDAQIKQAKEALVRNEVRGKGSLADAPSALKDSLQIRQNIATLEDRRDRVAQQFDADMARFEQLKPSK